MRLEINDTAAMTLNVVSIVMLVLLEGIFGSVLGRLVVFCILHTSLKDKNSSNNYMGIQALISNILSFASKPAIPYLKRKTTARIVFS